MTFLVEVDLDRGYIAKALEESIFSEADEPRQLKISTINFEF